MIEDEVDLGVELVGSDLVAEDGVSGLRLTLYCVSDPSSRYTKT